MALRVAENIKMLSGREFGRELETALSDEQLVRLFPDHPVTGIAVALTSSPSSVLKSSSRIPLIQIRNIVPSFLRQVWPRSPRSELFLIIG